MFQTKAVEETKTYILFPVTFFLKILPFWDNVEKYCTAVRATDDNMGHEYCMLDTLGQKHALRICNSYYFSSTILTQTLVKVMFQGKSPSCYLYAAKIKLIKKKKTQSISVEIFHLLFDPIFPYHIYDSSQIYYKIIARYAMNEFYARNFLP
jgi:hypothetical protein